MANPEHLAILKQGVEVWNKWNAKGLEDVGVLSPTAFRAGLASFRYLFALTTIH